MGAHFAFAAQFWGDRAVVCRAIEDRPGPVVEQQFGEFSCWTQANSFANKLNEGLDLDPLTARKIVTSSLLATACIAKQIHALCHEHHMEMRLTDGRIQPRVPSAQTLAYACAKPDCGIRYTPSNGYFIAAGEGQIESDRGVPHLRCPRDGRPMYLAETNPKQTAYRLWRCPQCDATRTNAEDLVNHIG